MGHSVIMLTARTTLPGICTNARNLVPVLVITTSKWNAAERSGNVTHDALVSYMCFLK